MKTETKERSSLQPGNETHAGHQVKWSLWLSPSMAHGGSSTADTHDSSSEEREREATPNPAHCHAVWLVSLGSNEGGQPLVSGHCSTTHSPCA